MEKVTTSRLKRLEDCFTLTEKISIYVPSTFNVDIVCDSKKYVEFVSRRLSELFGGATAINARGAYVSSEKGLIVEDVTIVYAYAEKLDNASIDKVLSLCDYLKEYMMQESIGLEINGKMYFY